MDVQGEELSGYDMSSMKTTGEYQELRTFLNDHIHQLMTTSVAFDGYEQLLWTGTQSGHVTSYFGGDLMKYTSFQAHHEEVRDILTDVHGILTLSQNQVRYTTKQGLKIFTSGCEEMHSMRKMLRGQGLQDNSVLLGGENECFFELDLSSGQVYQKSQQPLDPGTVVMKKSNHYLCCGQKTGQVMLLDPDRLNVCHTLEPHAGLLSDIDIGGNLLSTCGFSTRYNHYTADPFLMVYDLRTLRPFPPLQVPIEPSFVRFMPTYTLRCLVVSQSGEFLLCQPDSLVIDPGIYEVNSQGATIMDCCISENFQCLAFGDAGGYGHVWTNRLDGEISFNHNTQETVFADQMEAIDAFDIDDWSIPLTSIPLPHTNEQLLSDWPENLLKRADRPTPPIDADILKNMTIRQFVGYAPNPKKKLRNQVLYNLDEESRKYFPESPMSREPRNSVIPKLYRKVEIKYSKYGVEDFDFQHYNQTPFSGLEIHIPNAYCNSMLQSLYFLNIVRVKTRNHLCEREFCLACELGMLFYMLDISDDGLTCQATNFLRAFRTLPEASALGLLINDNEPKTKSMAQTIQNWNRFVLRQLHLDTEEVKDSVEDVVTEKEEQVEQVETNMNVNEEEEEESHSEKQSEETDEKPPVETSAETLKKKSSEFEGPSFVKSMFGIDVLSCRTCKCGTTHHQNVTLFTTDLTYPSSDIKDEEIYPFCKVLQESMMRKQSTQAWCERCKKYQSCQQVRKVLSIPDIININCQVESSREIEFWRRMNDLSSPKSDQKQTPGNSPIKTCRYGKYCTRQGCKFLHPTKDGEHTPISASQDEGGMVSSSSKYWLPPLIKVYHDRQSQEVIVTEYTQQETENESKGNSEEPENESKSDSEETENESKCDLEETENERKGDSEELKNESNADCGDKKYVVYKLMSNVSHILDPVQGSTLVAHARVEKGYHARKIGVEKSHWYVFNDFAVTPISEGEALSFNVDWKIPCILMYMRCDAEEKHSIQLNDTIDSKILSGDKSLAMRQSRFSRNFTPLNSTEILKEGDIVGMDAEFVTLNQEESEMRRDGTLSTLRPSQMSVARITVVRGWGPLQGVPFIDDYISTSEQVVDYLTKFSGIKPGDLDATVSSKHLTTLKTSYLKLRHLVDSKCVFVGHGLRKDCRVINLVLPRDQVVDTVELFHLPNQRLISLKFLAWHFLNIKIQAGTHDSAEDAYTAIKLYEKYRELLRAGEWVLEEELEILYDTGRQHNWQPPD